MWSIGQKLPFLQALRAYYLGLMGKYVPGKAYSLVLRADLARGPEVRTGLAGMTAFYEVLVTMTAGVVVAVLLFGVLPWQKPPVPLDWARLRGLLTGEASGESLDRNLALALALLPLAPLGLTILPPVFNRLAHRLSRRFRTSTEPLPQIRYRSLLLGLLLTSFGWLCLGASLGAILHGLFSDLPSSDLPSWDWDGWGRITACMGVVYVGSFLILIVPGSLGVREYLLMVLLVSAPEFLPKLTPADRRMDAILVAAALRVTWTAAEVVMVALVWWLPRPTSRPSKEPAR
jgi:hypothetical protein